MTGDEALQNLTQQINAAEMGMSKIIKCPYCGELLDFTPKTVVFYSDFGDNDGRKEVPIKPPTCCAEFALAVIAILGRKEQDERREFAERVMEKVSRN